MYKKFAFFWHYKITMSVVQELTKGSSKSNHNYFYEHPVNALFDVGQLIVHFIFRSMTNIKLQTSELKHNSR